MSKIEFISVAMVISSVLIACTREIQTPAENRTPSQKQMTVTASFEDGGTRTALSDGGTTVYWEPGDMFGVYADGSWCKYTSQCTELSQAASFLGPIIVSFVDDDGGSDILPVLYPYDESAVVCDDTLIVATLPSVQSARIGTFAKNANISLGMARKDANSYSFYNVCGGLRFTLTQTDVKEVTFEGNGGELLAGKFGTTFENGRPVVKNVVEGSSSVTLTAPGDSTFAVGKWYYIVTLPVTLEKGFRVTLKTDDKYATVVSAVSRTVRRGVYGSVTGIDKGLIYNDLYVDLSATGTANCHIVSQPGQYKFRADVKGNSKTPLDGTPATAEVLWESFGTSETPAVGDIVSDVRYDDGYVSFTSGLNGNAVIAVKDSSGIILWSWHIWVCRDYDPVAAAQVYNNNAGTMMDRNLGALCAAPGDLGALGLLYQWGRKDPFIGNVSVTSDSPYGTSAASTITWPRGVSSNESNGTIAYAIANPTRFITSATDWYYTDSTETEDSRWQTSDKVKTIYDPCPQGWRVPDGGDNSVWAKAFGTSSEFSKGPWDSTNRGMNFGSGNGKNSSMQLGSAETIWYPAAGCRSYSVSGIKYPGSNCYCWTSSCSGTSAYSFFFDPTGKVIISSERERAAGRSVRCIQE